MAIHAGEMQNMTLLQRLGASSWELTREFNRNVPPGAILTDQVAREALEQLASSYKIKLIVFHPAVSSFCLFAYYAVPISLIIINPLLLVSTAAFVLVVLYTLFFAIPVMAQTLIMLTTYGEYRSISEEIRGILSSS